MDIADFKFTTRLQVQWGDMDAAQHVNNIMYFRYVETTRVEYFRAINWYDSFSAHTTGPILAETYARYRRPLFYPDTIVVGAKTTSIEADRFYMTYGIYSEQQGVISTELTGTIVAFDYKLQKKTLLPQEVVEKIRQLENM